MSTQQYEFVQLTEGHQEGAALIIEYFLNAAFSWVVKDTDTGLYCVQDGLSKKMVKEGISSRSEAFAAALLYAVEKKSLAQLAGLLNRYALD